MSYFVGVDVGTGSVRAALVTEHGKIGRTHVEAIRTWNPQPDHYEQSSEDIWKACVTCIKTVVLGADPIAIKGIGFDATCSLVVLDKDGSPLSVSLTGNDEQNIILWMDHRAHAEASKINQTQHPVLRYVGGKISLEMETPKLLWLKNNLKERCWNKAGLFFDLPDFLTWKATGAETRSLCSLVCKWTYEITKEGKEGWNESYFKQVGLEDLAGDGWRKIGSRVLAPGCPVGGGLSAPAAAELGLAVGTPVGASIIDAHAGGLGLMGCRASGIDQDFSTRLGLICGTSTCHMAVSNTPIFTRGVWGPYFSAMVPGMWLNEGGQSATGKLIDHVIESHPATSGIRKKIGNVHIQTYLSRLLKSMARKHGLSREAFLTKDFHVYPDFHGNRSPFADATLKGMMSGLTLSNDEENLALVYLATIQALCYGTRHILADPLGYWNIISVLICGGLSKNPLFTQTQADVVNLPVVCPEEAESVLLGAAILGACAARQFPDVEAAARAMGGAGAVVWPDQALLDYHDKKYRVFLHMHQHQVQYRELME